MSRSGYEDDARLQEGNVAYMCIELASKSCTHGQRRQRNIARYGCAGTSEVLAYPHLGVFLICARNIMAVREADTVGDV